VPPSAARAAGLFGQPVPTLAFTSVQVEWRCYRFGAPDSDMHLFLRRPDSLHLSVAVARPRR